MKNRIVISLLAGTLALGACNLDETPYGSILKIISSRRQPMQRPQLCMRTAR